ncbi:DNA primase family protein [Paenibacillus agaridevorans]|uniref:DNA primase family protein n=1 Tax=Paenibacillus agaridevorans TaxID=171404 RepID=UPI001BE4DC25|nr:phage/plasmid primase, P4 family [Paenibacillus agaridevorans]
MDETRKIPDYQLKKLGSTEARRMFARKAQESTSPYDYTPSYDVMNVVKSIQNTSQHAQKQEMGDQNKNTKELRHPLAYEVVKSVLSYYEVICVEGRILVYDDVHGYFNEYDELSLTVLIRKGISKAQSIYLDRAKMSDVLHRIKSEPTLQAELSSLDSNAQVINFRNGVFDLLTGKLEHHSPDWKFTNFIDAEYLGNADDYFYESHFQKFLFDCTDRDPEKIQSLQELTGYIISNEWRAKKFFALIGLPHTGKSVWLEIWRSLIGAQFTTAVSLNQLGSNRFMIAELSRSKLNISAELDEKGMLKGVDLIKMITGGDMMTGERKGQDPFHFYPRSKLVVAGNRMPLPEGSDMTDAFLDRIHFLTFDYQVPEDKRDKGLIPKLLMEKDIIAAWAIEGLQRLHGNNYVFTECRDAIAFRKAYKNEKNSVQAFINEACIVNKADINLREHRRTLIKAYKEYCKSNCLRVMSESDFFNQLNNLGLKQKKFRLNVSNPLRGFLGIQLKEDEHDAIVQSSAEQSWGVTVYPPTSTRSTEA